MANSNFPEDGLRKQAWDYFQMHAAQRLSTFNFYIVITAVLSTALFTSFQKDYQIPGVGLILGFLLAFFSFIFWKLDLRNKELIKNAEAALKFFEVTLGPKDHEEDIHPTKLFLREEFHTSKKKDGEIHLRVEKTLELLRLFQLGFSDFRGRGPIEHNP